MQRCTHSCSGVDALTKPQHFFTVSPVAMQSVADVMYADRSTMGHSAGMADACWI